VVDPRKAALLKEGNESDRIDARQLAELLRTNQLKPVYHGEHGIRTLKELCAQSSHGQQRCHSHGEPDQIAVSQLGRETLFVDSRQIQKSSAKSMSN
jgi:hypothetical protein